MAELMLMLCGYSVDRVTNTENWLIRYRENWLKKNKESERKKLKKCSAFWKKSSLRKNSANLLK